MKRWAIAAVVLVLPACSQTPETRRAVAPATARPAGESAAPNADAPAATAAPSVARVTSSKRKATAKPGSIAALPAAGITDTEVKVGIAYISDPGTANAAAGFAGIGQVDQKRAWNAMIAEVNKNPPLGRKLVPVFYEYTTADVQSKGGDALFQEMCAKWTKDNKVFLAWSSGLDTLRSCLTKAGVAQLGGGSGFSYAKTWQDYPWLVEHNSPAQDRMAQFEIDNLHSRGFFTKFKTDPFAPPVPPDGKARIGLIRYDRPSYKAAAARMKQALASHGLALCSGCEFEVSYSESDVAAQLDDATEVNAAVENCRAKGCTHMLFLGSTAGVRITLFAVQRMEDQKYRPRLGFNSLDAPTAVRDFLGSSSYPQFQQSMLVGHAPRDFSVKTEAFTKCKAIFEAAGETFGGSDDRANNKPNQIGGYCDTAWYHIAAFNAIGRSKVSLQSWLTAVANVGRVQSVGAFVMETRADRRDGAGAVRIGEWFDNCNCFKATSGDIPV